MTRAFGADLRQWLGHATRNRFAAFLAGLGVTIAVQSSTATAVMISSFAGAGLIATAPALAVMLGADIGTTLVAQVLSVDLGPVQAVLIALGVVVFLTNERNLVRSLARLTIGLGLMLLALRMIVATASEIEDSEVALNFWARWGANRRSPWSSPAC